MKKHKGNPNKRKGSKPVMTKRTPKNKKRWERSVGYAKRVLMREFYFANV